MGLERSWKISKPVLSGLIRLKMYNIERKKNDSLDAEETRSSPLSGLRGIAHGPRNDGLGRFIK